MNIIGPRGASLAADDRQDTLGADFGPKVVFPRECASLILTFSQSPERNKTKKIEPEPSGAALVVWRLLAGPAPSPRTMVAPRRGLHAQILINIRPVDAQSQPRNLPILALIRGGCKEPRIQARGWQR